MSPLKDFPCSSVLVATQNFGFTPTLISGDIGNQFERLNPLNSYTAIKSNSGYNPSPLYPNLKKKKTEDAGMGPSSIGSDGPNKSNKNGLVTKNSVHALALTGVLGA